MRPEEEGGDPACWLDRFEPDGVRAVLLDSGGVLIRPVGGRWNPRLDFEDIVLRHAPGAHDFGAAIAAGEAFLASHAGATPSRDDYHRAVLGALGVEATPALLAELDAPPAAPPVEPFDDVLPNLRRLRGAGLRLAVVSDSWRTLPDLHAAVGLGGFFDAYAISEEVGATKPDPRMYRAASDALGFEPHECVFVDDSPALVAAAIDLGYGGVALCRDGTPPPDVDVPWISTLDQLAV